MTRILALHLSMSQLILVLSLLQVGVLTSESRENMQTCLIPESLNANGCETEGIHETSDNTKSSTWYEAVVSGLSAMFTPGAEPSNEGQSDDNEIDYKEIVASARLMAEQIGSDMGTFERDEFRERSAVFMSNFFTEEDDEGGKHVETPESGRVYQALTRRVAKQAGDIIEVDIDGHDKVQMIARSTRPPVFEVPNFLTEEECDFIVDASEKKGTHRSSMFTTKSEQENGSHMGIQRVSESTNLLEADLGEEFLEKLHTKVAQLVDLPLEVVQNSEGLIIGKYEKGGHYYSHLDSNEAHRELPCCFQVRCSTEPGPDRVTKDCCRICRYVTVLHYLSDVEEGGETAFPFADLTYTQYSAMTNWHNLSAHCDEASVRVKPEKGKTLVFYNHFIDRHGYLGPIDSRSHHGGCDVMKGTKWIATNWISTPRFSQRNVPSKYVRGTEQYP